MTRKVGRIPCGMRGLKSHKTHALIILPSHSLRNAWIEIYKTLIKLYNLVAFPAECVD